MTKKRSIKAGSVRPGSAKRKTAPSKRGYITSLSAAGDLGSRPAVARTGSLSMTQVRHAVRAALAGAVFEADA